MPHSQRNYQFIEGNFKSDFTPLHFLCGVMSLVLADKPEMIDTLKQNIWRVIADIPQKVVKNWAFWAAAVSCPNNK